MEPELRDPREELVREAVRRWRGQLIDLGGRNTLLYYRDLKAGTLDLGTAEPVALGALLEGRSVALRQLYRDPDAHLQALRRARTIRNKARELVEERGIETCFVAVGMATWANPKGAATPAAPVLLRSAVISARGAAEDDYDLTLRGDVEVNPTLLHLLANEFEVTLDADALEELVEQRTGEFDPAPLYERLTKEAAGRVRRFTIAPRHVLGTFSYAKLPMVTDLQTAEDVLIGHDVIAAIAGDREAQARLRAGGVPRVGPASVDAPAAVLDAGAADPDRAEPAEEYLVLDADSSQHRAINTVLAGQHTVVKGPPGTGKSQTIANLIASLVARGKRVLFVAEKRAAITAVTDRLARRGLGQLVMDVHDGTATRSRVAAELRAAFEQVSRIAQTDLTELHERLADRRARLSGYAEALHERREPWGVSVYEARSALLALRGAVSATVHTRLRGAALSTVDESAARRIREQLREYASLDGPGSPWAGAEVRTAEQAQQAFVTVSELARGALPEAREQLARVLAETGLREPVRLGDWPAVFELLDGVAATLDDFEPRIFSPDLPELVAAAAPRAWRREHPDWPGVRAGWLGRRRLRAYVRSLWLGSRRRLRDGLGSRRRLRDGLGSRRRLRDGLGSRRLRRGVMFTALLAAAEQAQQWAAMSRDGGPPRLAEDLTGAAAATHRLAEGLGTLAVYLPRLDVGAVAVDFGGQAPDEADRLLAGLVADERTLRRLPRLTELRTGLGQLGLEPLLTEWSQAGAATGQTGAATSQAGAATSQAGAATSQAETTTGQAGAATSQAETTTGQAGAATGQADPARAVAMFDTCWYASILEYLGFADSRIGAFDGALHSRTADEYRAADHAHLDSTATRVLRAVAEHVVAARDAYPDESRLVEHQANLKRRHLPMRQLFAAAPNVLTALKPCWAMSPLVVSQLLPADRQYFDVVVFDEASQVTPADAVPALVRANQVVVAGDEHQLPPTAFFTVADDHDDSPVGLTADGQIDSALTTGYESVLDVLSALLPAATLRWHYRSQDERLIAFSNGWVYGQSLVTFPGTTGTHRLRHVAVAQDSDDPTSTDAVATNSVLAEVERVVALALEHAARSPDESLGIITMGITHADRVDLALRRALARRPELHRFFAESRPEPFFVKNLERVQGDERDAVILTVGYGKTADGRLLYRFGPLLLPGGHRRLNVAVTRARRRMTLVSSFTAADMDPARGGGDGVQLLRAYLEYAESGGASLGAVAVQKPALGALGEDIRDCLVAAGIAVTAQYGVAGYAVELAAAHPQRPDEMVLAIETDGPAYYASGSARDRDRLRQEHLQRLGWAYHRIWSADWFADPQAELARVQAAYAAAVAAADAAVAASAALAAADAAVLPAVQPSTVELLREPASPEAPPGPPIVDPTPTVRLSDITGRSAPRPQLRPGQPITAYSQGQLVELVRWIESDTLLRTEEQVIDEVVRELGFQRRGPRIRAAVVAALRALRDQREAGPATN